MSDPQSQARPSFDSWLAQIKRIGLTDPLTHFRDNSFGQINLERAHPGGLAQFVTGRPALLSNLVRDPLSFSRALAAARRIKAKQLALHEGFGLETLFMASGVVDLTGDGQDLIMPILLWPVNLISKSDDFELSLSRKAIVNPALAPALYRAYGVRLNNDDLLAHVQVGSDPIPMKVLEHISALVDENGAPELKRVLVISNFSSVAIDLASDFQVVDHPVLNLFTSGVPAEEVQGIADPIMVADADQVQTRIVSKALAGASLAVETLPGCGYTQSVVQLMAALAHQGKRVLVLAPRRQTLNELADRVSQIGLAGLGIRSHNSWLDLVSAISRNEKATEVNYEASKELRDIAREEVSNYFVALEKVDGELGVSISACLEELARLSASVRPPVNEARIDQDQLGRHKDLSFALTLLRQAQELGEFEIGPNESAWYRAKFENPMEVQSRIELATTLYEGTFQNLSQQLSAFTQAVEFQPAKSVSDWITYLELFVGIRDSLDRFRPEVFDRPLNELILATAPRRDKSVMSGANRRRLKKLAKEYLRPGMGVTDMHQALRAIQNQREQWQRHCLVAKPPQVPLGIKNAQLLLQSFVADLAKLQDNLDPESSAAPLIEQPLDQLARNLRSLAEDTQILENYPERSMTQARLDEAGLGPLSRELAKLHTSREDIEAELRLSWWKSALETLLARTTGVLSSDQEQVIASERRFAELEGELIANGSKAVAYELSKRWRQAIAQFPAEAQTLKELLKLKRAVLSEVGQLAPNVYRALTPIVMLSPYEVPTQLAESDHFDVALVLDGAGSSIAENLSGLLRVRQAVVFGDDTIAAATGFALECLPNAEDEPEETESIFTASKAVMPLEVLRKSYRTSGQALGGYINSEFYQDRIIYDPTADEYFGRKNSHLEIVSKPQCERAESPDQEVAQTLELIFNHALWNAEDSLLVATASPRHAERLQQALGEGMRTRAHLAEFFDGHGREKFEITTIQNLTHRIADRVIFSVGFGRTSNGELPESLGLLSHQASKRYLANLLVSARKQITVVSAYRAGEFSGSSIAGSQVLEELLGQFEASAPQSFEPEVNPMISDLAIRLAKLGVTTRTNFSPRFKLVASVGETASVIEPDWGILGFNLSERHRLRPRMLEAMGWRYIRVPSFKLFADPEGVAQSIAIELGIELAKKPQPLFDLDSPAWEDTPQAWGDRDESNDSRLREDKPPHWG